MSSIYQQADFLLSVGNIKQLPTTDGFEVAFAGRSNAGKSSAINTLTDNRKLARTSKTPGRTQLINFFQLDESRFLVDLPGYGYAKVPQAVKQKWHVLLNQYLTTRKNLKGIVLVMDCRHPMKTFDQDMLGWCQQSGMPAHLLLTKSDKLKKGAAKATLLKIGRQVDAEFGEVSLQLFSSLNKMGVGELVKQLNRWMEL